MSVLKPTLYSTAVNQKHTIYDIVIICECIKFEVMMHCEMAVCVCVCVCVCTDVGFDAVVQKGHGHFALLHHHPVGVFHHCTHLILKLLQGRLLDDPRVG